MKDEQAQKPIIAGFAWHEYDDRLIEWCWDYEGSMQDFLSSEPKALHEEKLRYFKMVKGSLPLPLHEARVAWDRAWDAHRQAEDAYMEVRNTADRTSAWAARQRAWTAYMEAEAAYRHTKNGYASEIAALHDQECPNCTWGPE